MNDKNHFTLEDCLRLYLLPEEREDFQQHLDQCPDCLERFRRVQREMRDQAAQFQQQIETVPENFWATQRHQILWRVSPHSHKNLFWGIFDLRVWVTIATVFALSAVLIRWNPDQSMRTYPVERRVERVEIKDYRDELLLRQVNQALNEDQADPLQPLDLLVKVPDSSGQNADKDHYHETS